ncbi:MAG: PQQ-binding-like beta-propeller repeat protein [Sinobacteraceae bacterium]|nr:PQQ-binding-like beta-propeller repeat protein [Nevskiaceae bacterium]
MKATVAIGVLLLLSALAASAEQKNLDWTRYGHDLANTRFQDVDQIDPSNVAEMHVAWTFHTGVLDAKSELEVSPIKVGQRLYVTDGHDDVFALNAATGQQLWSYKPTQIPGEMPPLDSVFACCGLNNRGVVFVPGASHSGQRDDLTSEDNNDSKPQSDEHTDDTRKGQPAMVVYGRLDDVVVALNAKTGEVIWKTRVVDFHSRAAINMAPQFAHGLIIVGLAGGEYEIRGLVVALKAESGEIAWRFHTRVPESWAGDSWQRGGAPMWQTPSIDTRRNLVYVATGNAGPDINGINRAGENLFSASVVALDLDTGVPRWHFQETHHDLWDYDSAQPTMLFEVEKDGRNIPALGHCSKNGNYYILDRRTGEPVFPVKEVDVPTAPVWQNASPTQPVSSVEPLTPLDFVPGTIDMTKLPKDLTLAPQYTVPQDPAVLIPVGDDGGCEGVPAAFSPRTKFIYYGARYEPATYHTTPDNTGPSPDGTFLGSSFAEVIPGVTDFGIFGATNSTTGKVVWKIQVPQPAKSGMLVAGDLVFFGEGNGQFHAVDATTGKMLFTFNGTSIPGGGGAQASPIAYVVKGKEFIVNAFGGNVPDRQFAPNPVGDAIVAFSLP